MYVKTVDLLFFRFKDVSDGLRVGVSLESHTIFNVSEIFWIHLMHPPGKEPVERVLERAGNTLGGDCTNCLCLTARGFLLV